MKPKNMLFIFSDEHTREITGCYGNAFVKTPHLDRLAKSGSRFDNAYTGTRQPGHGPLCA
jgi:choline-sulfatase